MKEQLSYVKHREIGIANTSQGMPQYPFFYARKQGDDIQTRGTTDCVLGHELFGDRQSRGPFAQWTWDGRRLEVSNDRYGFNPIYY